jgi:hypothetical protein
MKNGAEDTYHVNQHVFVCLDLGGNVSSGRNALSEKRFFGWIFKQILKFNVAVEAETCSVGLFLPRCFRREETFLRGLIGLEVLW